MRKSILVLPAVAAVLTLGVGAAQASVSAIPRPDGVVGNLTNMNGTAGFYTNEFGDTFTQVNGTFSLNLPSLFRNGAIGIQLCNSTTGYAAQVGAIADGTAAGGGWTVGYFTGYLDPATGINGDPCDGNTFLKHITGGGFTALGTVSAGTTVQAQIKEVGHGLVFTVADGPLANFNYFLFSFPGFFNEAAAGISENLSLISAPAINTLSNFSGVTATDANEGLTDGFATWNAVEVSSGYPGYAPLVTTGPLTPSTGTVCTFHKGHFKWVGPKGHAHRIWVKGYTTCSGGGPSSFAIYAGSPIQI